MSIITDALTKAKKEKVRVMTSEEYLNKIIGPTRKETIAGEEIESNRSQLQGRSAVSETSAVKIPKSPFANRKMLITTGVLLISAIVFLTFANIFFISTSDVELAIPAGNISESAVMTAEVEAYSDAKSELVEIEGRTGFMDKMAKVLRGESAHDEFRSNFILSGIVYDEEEPWAVINNEVVKIGDTLDGARVISIFPQKVVLIFKDEKFDLAVK